MTVLHCVIKKTYETITNDEQATQAQNEGPVAQTHQSNINKPSGDKDRLLQSKRLLNPGQKVRVSIEWAIP